ADVPTRPQGDRLPRAGAVDLPEAERRGERARDSGDARSPPGAGARTARGAPGRARADRSPEEQGLRSVRRRTPPPRDHQSARAAPQIHAARRAVRRDRSDRGQRHPADRAGAEGTKDRCHHLGPQRGTDAGYRGSSLHHVRGTHSGDRDGLRAGLERRGGRDLSRSHAHRPHAIPLRAPVERDERDGSDSMSQLNTKLYQSAHLRQEMRINPRLYQAMELLYMPLLDLQQHLKEELTENPFPEMAEADVQQEVPLQQATKDAAPGDEVAWEEILPAGCDVAGRRQQYGQRESLESTAVERPDLHAHLPAQRRRLSLTEREIRLG